MDERVKIFSCKRCGSCCHGETTVSLDEHDQRRMIEFLDMPRDLVQQQFWRVTGSVVQMKVVDHHCIFYRDGCTVYDGRPWRCRQWPLVPAILLDKANFSAIGASCPGINQDLPYAEFCRILEQLITLSDQPGDATNET